MRRSVFVIAVFVMLLSCSELFAQGTIKWKFPLTSTSCSYEPALSNDGATLYVPSGNSLVAINLASIQFDANKIVTNTSAATLWTYSMGTYVNTPSVDPNGNIYIQSQPSGVMKISSNGAAAWSNVYNPRSPSSWPGADGASRIAIGKEGDIYVSEGGGKLHSIYSADGTQKWVSDNGQTGGTKTPAIGSTGLLYSAGYNYQYYLYSMNPANKQSVNFGTLPSSVNLPSIGADNSIYNLGSNYLYKIGADQSVWSPQYYHGGYPLGQPATASDGTIYSVTSSKVTAVNPDGTLKWAYTPNFTVSGTPAVGNDGMIYVVSQYGMIGLTSEGSLDWRINDAAHIFFSSPVMGPDGTLYALGYENQGYDRYLYAISTSSTSPAPSSWPMFGANAQHTFQAQIETVETIADPAEGGTITTSPSGTEFIKGTEVTFTANANQNWAFGYWEWNDGSSSSTENPMALTINGPETVTANFFRTFRNAVGDFRKIVGDTGGWCTDYVNYETGAAITGNAYQWLQNAVSAGYKTGSTSTPGAIVVFSSDTIPPYGHVGIVTGDMYVSNGHTYLPVRDSNWCTPYCFLVNQHDMDITEYPASGYIYYAP